jgi:hypothetical protein
MSDRGAADDASVAANVSRRPDTTATHDVRFEALELWPDSADPAQVHVGLFQSYLERVT